MPISARGRRFEASEMTAVELRCPQCGYGLMVRSKPLSCPRCAWQEVDEPRPPADEVTGCATVARPDWPAVEALLTDLATTQATFATTFSRSNRISRYEPGWRLQLETDQGARWVDVASIRSCWETFERLGRIRRADVLEPGRCSAFMMALFGQLNGVHQESEGETVLVFSTGT